MTALKRIVRGRALAAVVAGLAVLTVMIGTGAPAHAAPEQAVHARPHTIAIAMGAIQEPSGGHTWLSLQAGTGTDGTRGGFRYYCEEAGYYNGAVRPLTVTEGAIHAEGAGGLRRPDGTRMRVQFTLDIAALLIAAGVFIALFVFKRGMIVTLVVGAVVGMAKHFVISGRG